jgi:hypothetical protein
MESIEQIALEMNREQGDCPSCEGTQLKGRGQNKDANASNATVPAPSCGHCDGNGFLWFPKRVDPSMSHPLSLGVTSAQMVEMWEKQGAKER